MKKFALLTTLTTASLFADAGTQPVIEEADLPGHYQVNGYGVTLSGSALFWKPRENGVDYVIKNNGTVGLNNFSRVKRAKFDWDWGFRFGIGYQVPKQKMDLDVCWTHLTSSGKSTQTAVLPATLFSVWSLPVGGAIPPVSFEQNATAHARLHLNMVDLGMGATFSPRPFLDITPFIDLTTAWIHQKFDLHLSGGPGLNGHTTLDDHIKLKNNYWGIGPKAGLNTLWHLGCGLGIAANVNLSLLYGLFSITEEEQTTFSGLTPATNYLDLASNSFHQGTFNFDCFLGMRWDQVFADETCHFFLEAGWENLIFMNQNQLMRFPSQINHAINISQNGDLTMQGLTMRAAITF